MSAEIAFNELSLTDKAPTIDEAFDNIRLLVTVLSETQQRLRTKNLSLRCPSSMIIAEVAPYYSIIKWINDSRVDKEQSTYLLTLLTSQPYLDEISDDHAIEVKYKNTMAKGIAYAYKQNLLTISMPKSDTWDRTFLDVNVTELSDDGIILSYEASVRHASTVDNLDSHSDWFTQNRDTQLSDGSSLPSLFPEIHFIGNSLTQLKALGKDDPKTRSLFKSLSSIKNYLSTWQEGALDISKLKNLGLTTIRPESEATLLQYGHERMYIDPHGNEKMFKWHFDITTEWRGYIDWNDSDRQIWITYIGRHLSTKKYN